MIKKIIKKILPQRIKYLFFIFKWRKLNKHNNVTPLNIIDINKVKVDVGSYGPIIVKSWGAKNENLTIGKFCSISEGVKFILGGNHYIKQLSNFSFEHYFENNLLPAESKGPIIVEDGVWIGTDALILSGVTLGKGCVIAARSVVSKNVDPFTIVAGNPAVFIKTRFNEEIINKLLPLDYYDKVDKEFYFKNKEIFNSEFDSNILESLIKITQNEYKS